jgi:hypothetical protein
MQVINTIGFSYWFFFTFGFFKPLNKYILHNNFTHSMHFIYLLFFFPDFFKKGVSFLKFFFGRFWIYLFIYLFGFTSVNFTKFLITIWLWVVA